MQHTVLFSRHSKLSLKGKAMDILRLSCYETLIVVVLNRKARKKPRNRAVNKHNIQPLIRDKRRERRDGEVVICWTCLRAMAYLTQLGF